MKKKNKKKKQKFLIHFIKKFLLKKPKNPLNKKKQNKKPI